MCIKCKPNYFNLGYVICEFCSDLSQSKMNLIKMIAKITGGPIYFFWQYDYFTLSFLQFVVILHMYNNVLLWWNKKTTGYIYFTAIMHTYCDFMNIPVLVFFPFIWFSIVFFHNHGTRYVHRIALYDDMTGSKCVILKLVCLIPLSDTLNHACKSWQ